MAQEWEETLEGLRTIKHTETRRLYRMLQGIYPEVESACNLKEKQYKRKLLQEMPRRASDRIARKTEEVCVCVCVHACVLCVCVCVCVCACMCVCVCIRTYV